MEFLGPAFGNAFGGATIGIGPAVCTMGFGGATIGIVCSMGFSRAEEQM